MHCPAVATVNHTIGCKVVSAHGKVDVLEVVSDRSWPKLGTSHMDGCDRYTAKCSLH